MTSSSATPIYQALVDYCLEKNLRLHMPGHAGGPGFDDPLLQQMAAFDVTEVPGMDDLHLPVSIIQAAQQKLAQAFGARESFFLVNGATSGIHALFMTLPPGSRVMMPRNVHRSFYGGMVMAGVHPVYIPVQAEKETGAILAVDPSDIADRLVREKAAALFLTSPTYYGTTSNIRMIARYAHDQGVPVFIDEAHGAHFYFHPGFPEPALPGGADAVVHGLHKTWPVFNQGAALHLGENMPDAEKVKAAFSILTTTSPSYPLLATLDLARHRMQVEGYSRLEEARQMSGIYREKIDRLPGMTCPGERLLGVPGVQGVDPLKLLVVFKGLALTGFEAARLLRERFHIQVELEDQCSIMAMMSMFHQQDDWERFYRGLQAISKEYAGSKANDGYKEMIMPPDPVVVKSPREAFFASRERVSFSSCLGRVAAEMVAAYPPGIPALLPGELITTPVIEYLEYLRCSPARVQGPQDRTLATLAVLQS